MSGRETLLTMGEPAPWVVLGSRQRPDFKFDTLAGRYVVVTFFLSTAWPFGRRIVDAFMAARGRFDDELVSWAGVSIDPDDDRLHRAVEALPGMRPFWDFDGAASRLYGALRGAVTAQAALAAAQAGNPAGRYFPHTLVLDRQLRVVEAFPFIEFGETPERHVMRVLEAVDRLPPVDTPQVAALQAPVLVLPRVFEPELCRRLIAYYDERGGEESGFMRERDGMTVSVTDYSHKQRRDQEIEDQRLKHSCMVRIHDRILTELQRAYQFRASRIERYIVACYDAATGGHFRPHRDNTTKGTAHRRFAVSLHLNSGEYEGGYLRFPEFGNRLYIAPPGGAVVFSCSLMHEAMPVTRGRRYMFLPFLYDDAAAAIRQENAKYLAVP
jgi:predicted 2-oxoglutarate/Fe(II)-dependent dioxygenase YbiX/peroxiredoxin